MWMFVFEFKSTDISFFALSWNFFEVATDLSVHVDYLTIHDDYPYIK